MALIARHSMRNLLSIWFSQDWSPDGSQLVVIGYTQRD
jgi:hypothetical protein